jgi:hypothetical protein
MEKKELNLLYVRVVNIAHPAIIKAPRVKLSA